MAPVRGSLRFTLTRPAVQVTAIRSDPLPPVTVSSDPLTEERDLRLGHSGGAGEQHRREGGGQGESDAVG